MRRPPGPAVLAVTPPPVRRRYGGTIWSLLAHLALIAALFWTIDRDFATVVERGAPLSPRRGGGGGGGGGYVALPALPAPAPRPVTPVVIQQPQPVPVQTVPLTIPETVPPPRDTTPTIPAPTAAPADAPGGPGTGPGTGGGTGGGAGSGNGPGNGAGTGPGNGNGGDGGRGRHAESKRQVFPPTEGVPKELQGRSVSVTFWIGVDGKLLRFDIYPPIEDKGFAKKFAEIMREQEFKPAHGPDGQPVPDSLTYTWTF
jgi:hypothetical protein